MINKRIKNFHLISTVYVFTYGTLVAERDTDSDFICFGSDVNKAPHSQDWGPDFDS